MSEMYLTVTAIPRPDARVRVIDLEGRSGDTAVAIDDVFIHVRFETADLADRIAAAFAEAATKARASVSVVA